MSTSEFRHWLLDEIDGTRVVKDGCGIFGILRKERAPKISCALAVRGISCVKYRGSRFGAGFASFNLDSQGRGVAGHNIMAFVKDEATAMEIERELLALGSIENKVSFSFEKQRSNDKLRIWESVLYRSNGVSERTLEKTIDQINARLISGTTIRGRIFSYGRYLKVFKGVGYPEEVGEMFGFEHGEERADMWIAHTRQPTNSPGNLPVWSHPFASMDCAIVHNGDISSFGSNIELLKSWGITSHIGTDSEVIARLLDKLLREQKLGIREAITVLTNPFEENMSKAVLSLVTKYKGARLDGPFAVVAGYCDGDDCYMIALTDRSKFRPMILGEDDNYFYAASEESQIRILSEHAKTWAPEPGSYFIASQKLGLIESGTRRGAGGQDRVVGTSTLRFSNVDRKEEEEETNLSMSEIFSAKNMDFRQINALISEACQSGKSYIRFTEINGQRYIGIGFSFKKIEERGDSPFSPPVAVRTHFKIELEGFPGNCLANLNDGAIFEVFGNVADDAADTMHSGSLIIHGSARDVLGQALQGGTIFVRGSVGNRAAIQMREYQDNKPFLIVGETADDYLGEYMAGGVVCILNLSDLPNPVGKYVGSGMVGGRIYVRGRVDQSRIGLNPNREDILTYLKVALDEEQISQENFSELSKLDFLSTHLLKSKIPSRLFERLNFLFFSSKYSKPLSVTQRRLTNADMEILSEPLSKFFRVFSIPEEEMLKVTSSEFTVIQATEEETKRPLPPQEVPVEE
jgi:glutamate synthase domain-containing protein 1/glutamate synthase domain-containing protein 3